ncbi:MAG: thioredoxin [Planctomycetota bacterium]
MADKAIQLDQASFDELTSQPGSVVLIDFWAEWCPPCKILGPTIDEIAGEVGESIAVTKLDVDHNKELAAKFGISSIPTVVILVDGKEVERFVGVQPKDVYLDALASHAA